MNCSVRVHRITHTMSSQTAATGSLVDLLRKALGNVPAGKLAEPVRENGVVKPGEFRASSKARTAVATLTGVLGDCGLTPYVVNFTGKRKNQLVFYRCPKGHENQGALVFPAATVAETQTYFSLRAGMADGSVTAAAGKNSPKFDASKVHVVALGEMPALNGLAVAIHEGATEFTAAETNFRAETAEMPDWLTGLMETFVEKVAEKYEVRLADPMGFRLLTGFTYEAPAEE